MPSRTDFELRANKLSRARVSGEAGESSEKEEAKQGVFAILKAGQLEEPELAERLNLAQTQNVWSLAQFQAQLRAGVPQQAGALH